MIDARRALLVTNDMVSMKPFVVLAIRMLGPGRRRLEMVKLAHDLSYARGGSVPAGARPRVAVGQPQQAAPPSERAA